MGAFGALVKQDDCGFSKGMIEDEYTLFQWAPSAPWSNRMIVVFQKG